jgi:hypothetical protein
MAKIVVYKESIVIDDRYQMYQDGVIYDTTQAKDIPQWIFEFRDFVLTNYETMKGENT